ncbi:MAG TPA: c-type cytochrome [Gammaproteobacteria bacterium]|nr:c-type cytochrome [Gammaproteobacteria bacterium]
MDRRVVFCHVLVLSLLVFAIGAAHAGDPQRGRQIYIDHCAGCHGLTGSPTMAAVPAFSRGEGVMKPDQELLTLIKRGRNVMPGYEGLLSDMEIRDTLAYIRTLF